MKRKRIERRYDLIYYPIDNMNTGRILKETFVGALLVHLLQCQVPPIICKDFYIKKNIINGIDLVFQFKESIQIIGLHEIEFLNRCSQTILFKVKSERFEIPITFQSLYYLNCIFRKLEFLKINGKYFINLDYIYNIQKDY